ncbi:MAG: methyltransferase domain-containing protein [Candidatus Dadabacteria bacterium]|nr:MAG: methyltransferase domain-containing protein [Candidatus Dadabacteria bacterium]
MERELSTQENTAHSDDKQQPDVASIMARIRQRVKNQLNENSNKKPSFHSFKADFEKNRKAGELLHSEELRYLNSNYIYSPRLQLEAVTTHRRGPLAKLVVKFKRKVLAIVWDYLLKDYFEAEKNYQANLVRYLNDVSKYVDARDAANFWELIRKIDVDITRALERIERINDEQTASLRTLERSLYEALNSALKDVQSNLHDLNENAAVSAEKLKTLESVVSGIEGILASLGKKEMPPEAERGESDDYADFSYLLLENRFRGSEEEIAERLSIYPPYFKGAKNTVLEIGSGRGELQKLLSEAGINCRGIDTDRAMVERARQQGFDVLHGDGIGYLRTLEDRELSGLIAIQVVEHLPQKALEELIQLAAKKVESGGKIIFETINPRSLLALSSNYFRDPTHVFPLHPDTLSYTVQLAGLKVIELKELSAVPEEARLRKIKVEEFMTPRWAALVENINRNIDQLNDLIYGYQDYCIVAEVP